MIPSCFPWKVVIFFGKEHVNRSSISWIMIGFSWEIKFGKINYLFGNTNFEFSKLDFPTSSYHNSTNTGLIDMFFTKKYNYFSQATRWSHLFLSLPPLKGCFGTLKLTDEFYWHWLYIYKSGNWYYENHALYYNAFMRKHRFSKIKFADWITIYIFIIYELSLNML